MQIVHTHIRLTALCPGLPGCAGTRKIKPIWILLKQETEWQWHQLGYMQVCTSLQTDNHASIPPLSFFTARMPFLPPNQQCQSTEGSTMQVVKGKGKVFPYSLPSVGPGADPGVQAVSPQVT